MKKQWTVTADGVNHTIEYKGRNLLVDGQKSVSYTHLTLPTTERV